MQHSHNVGNFGGSATCLWDRLCGTDTAYRAHQAKLARAPSASAAAQ